jgi:hypothetical protein
MRLTDIGADKETDDVGDLRKAIRDYDAPDDTRTRIWSNHFNSEAESLG